MQQVGQQMGQFAVTEGTHLAVTEFQYTLHKVEDNVEKQVDKYLNKIEDAIIS